MEGEIYEKVRGPIESQDAALHWSTNFEYSCYYLMDSAITKTLLPYFYHGEF